MTLADRLNKIIDEKNISKREFAKRVGISENYVYTLTGESNKITTLSPMLAKVIAMEFVTIPTTALNAVNNLTDACKCRGRSPYRR